MSKNLQKKSKDLGPSAPAAWAQSVGSLLRDVELELIRMIRDSVSKDLGANRYTVQRLAELAVVRARVEAQLGRSFDQVIAEAEEVLKAARAAGQGQAITDLRNAGLPTGLPPQMAMALSATAMDTIAAITGMKPLILREFVDAYQTLMAGPVSMVATGAVTRVEATQAALREWAYNGVAGFVDRGGREWSPDAYAEMAVRTGGMNAMREGYAMTLRAVGEDLVRVTGHGYTCPKCAKYQGKILSLTGRTPNGRQQVMHATEDRYIWIEVTASVQEATADGLWHPNCGHGQNLFLPGITTLYDGSPNLETYDASQAQRNLELEIRKLKRELAASFTPEAKTEVNSKIRVRQKQIRELVNDHPMLTRKRRREQIKTAH